MKCLALVLSILMLDSGGYAAPGKDCDPREVQVRSAGRGFNFYSRSREIELGKELARDFELDARLIEDPVVSEYVNRIGQNLVNQAGARYCFVIKVVRSEEVNALALPGGFLYINSGLILAAGNEAELAVALAHEIGHVAARHYTRQASWADLLSYAAIPLVFIGGWPGLVVQQSVALGTPLALRKFSRAAETEADMLAIQYLDRAGYDPAAFVDFFERIAHTETAGNGIFTRMLAVHPSPASRVRAAQKEIQRGLTPHSLYVIQTSEFQRVRERLAAIANGKIVTWRAHPSTATDPPPVLRRAPSSGN